MAGVALTGATAYAYYLNTAAQRAHASGPELLPAEYPWHFERHWGGYDHAAMRRGYEVYRQICATCHSMSILKYRQLVGVTHTTAQAKALAMQMEVQDGPTDKGEYYMRPGQLGDAFKKPYVNNEQARSINNGSLPPDLSCITKGREPEVSGHNYVFSLMTGFGHPPPAGINLREGLHYNPYFPGGAIGMAQPLSDGMMDYEDGTPATVTQMARDVVEFLNWASEPDLERRHFVMVQVMGAGLFSMLGLGYTARWRWVTIRTRKRSWAGPRYNMKTPPTRD